MQDLAIAMDLSRSGSALANKHRKSLSIASRVTGLVTGSTSSVAFFKGMTPTQRHAELVYAECLAQKAILGIVYSGVCRNSCSLFISFHLRCRLRHPIFHRRIR